MSVNSVVYDAVEYDKPVNYIFEFVKSKSMVAVYFIVFIVIYGYIMTMNKRREILDRWDEYRYNIAVLPFSGYLKPFEDTSAAVSSWYYFLDFLGMICKKAFGYVVGPISAALTLLTKLAGEITLNADMIRKQIAIIRNMIADIVMSIYRKLESMINASTYAFSRIENILKRVAAIFQTIYHYMQISAAIFVGMTKGGFSTLITMVVVLMYVVPYLALGPVGLIFTYLALCFDEHTVLTLEDGSQKYIRDVKIGDVLMDGGRVVSKIRVCVDALDTIYDYRGIRVSGSHYVLQKGEWCKVCDAEGAVPVEAGGSAVLYNLNTTTHRIFANAPNATMPIIFMDYDETSDGADVERENSEVLRILNGRDTEKPHESPPPRRYKIGYGTPYVETADTYGYIQHIVEDRDVIVKIGARYLTEWVKVKMPDGSWICARDHPEAYIVGVSSPERPTLLWCVVTRTHEVDLGDGIVVRDFIEK